MESFAAASRRRELQARQHEIGEQLDGAARTLDSARRIEDAASQIAGALDQALAPRTLAVYVRRAERFRLFARLASPSAEPAPTTLASGEWLRPRLSAEPSESGKKRSDLLIERSPEASTHARAIDDLLAEIGGDRLLLLPAGPESPAADRGPRGLVILGAPVGSLPTPHAALDRFARAAGRALDALTVTWQTLVDRHLGSGLRECPACRRCFDPPTRLCPFDDRGLDASLAIDRRPTERFRLDRRLSDSGARAVYQAHDLETDQPVAFKVIDLEAIESSFRFEIESSLTERLDHPAIVRGVACGRIDSRYAFLAMELLRGVSLRQHLDRHGPMAPDQLAPLVEQLGRGLSHAHARGVLHRDLKPENVVLLGEADRRTVKILDFGLAKITNQSDGYRTGSGRVLGTPLYMAPEQLAASPLDARADQFSLAVLVHEALLGVTPWHTRNLAALVRAVSIEPYELEVRDDSQRRVRSVLARALAKSPDDRWPSVQIFRARLVPALRAATRFAAKSG